MSIVINTRWGRMRGVQLDPDQMSLNHCSFEECSFISSDEPLHLLVIDRVIMAVCEHCYQERFQKEGE